MFSSNVLYKVGQFELGSKTLEPRDRCHMHFRDPLN